MTACRASGRPFFLLALDEATDEATTQEAGVDHAWVRIGAIGKALETLRAHGVEELVLAGKVARPKLSSLRPDLKGTRLLARLGSQFIIGDNELLEALVRFPRGGRLRVVGAEEVVRDLLAPEGLIGSVYPDKRAQADIEFGARVARAIGALDVGQGVIVHNQMVLGVEAVEGTDALIIRCAALRPDDKGGVLIKAKKPQQDRRTDLPTIGVAKRLAEYGFAGVAVEAGASLIVGAPLVARMADKLGVFVVGFSVLE
ncbi:MAG: UDP-2,3-diacylglucosamine diphosphatase LpxI [Alphaproteobacteria bacterium]